MGRDGRLTPAFAAVVGYRALGLEFEDGSGSERFECGLRMYGPLLGLRWSF